MTFYNLVLVFLYSFLNGRRSVIFQFDEILDPIVYVFRNWTCDFFIWHISREKNHLKMKCWIFVCCHALPAESLRNENWESSECVNKNESVVFWQLFIQFKLNKKNLFIALIWWTWDNNSSLSLKINLSVSGKAWSRKKLLLKNIESFDFLEYGLNFDAIFLVVSHPTTTKSYNNHGWRNFSIFTRTEYFIVIDDGTSFAESLLDTATHDGGNIFGNSR